nr:hypothetical protein [Candidatus Njordarchaeota archaeon]
MAQDLLSKIEEVISDRSIGPEQVEQKLREVGLPPGDPNWIEALKRLARANVYRFYGFIGQKLVEVAGPNCEFYLLLEELVPKHSDMFAAAWVKIGRENPNSEEILRDVMRNPKLLPAVGGFLGGYAQAHASEALPMIKTLMSKNSEDPKFIAVSAIAVAAEKYSENTEVLQLLESAAIDQSLNVRMKALISFFSLYAEKKRFLRTSLAYFRTTKSFALRGLCFVIPSECTGQMLSRSSSFALMARTFAQPKTSLSCFRTSRSL